MKKNQKGDKICFLFSNFFVKMEITNKLLLDWVQHLENNQYATTTIENYFASMKLFLEFVKREISVDTVTEKNLSMINIDRWKILLSKTLTPPNSIYYAKRPTISLQTIQGKLTAIKSFLKYLNNYYDCWISYRRIELKKVKSDYIECINDTEFNLFMDFIGRYEKYKINSLRMQLLCNIWYTSWLRLSEMLGLTIHDIMKGETRITWKGKKTRWVFFTKSSEELLNQYMEEREKPIPWTWKRESGSDYVFISHNSGYDYGKPISKTTVCEKIKKYSDSLAIWKRITMHSLRHSYATKLLEAWMNIREIQELLGHCDIQTTEWYCHVLKSSLKNKVSLIFE